MMAGRFLTPLEVRELEDTSSDGRGTWRLLSDLVFFSEALQLQIVAVAGFVTDFASVPRLPIVFFLLGGLARRAAVIHDYLYTVNLLTRAESDAVLREAAAACGVPRWKSWALWAGVRVGGRSAWTAPGQLQPAAVLMDMP